MPSSINNTQSTSWIYFSAHASDSFYHGIYHNTSDGSVCDYPHYGNEHI